METAFSWTSGGYAGSATGATTYNAAPAGASGNGAVSGGQLGVYFAFIQFAGFTMGKEKCIAARIPLPDIGIDCVHDFGRSILSPREPRTLLSKPCRSMGSSVFERSTSSGSTREWIPVRVKKTRQNLNAGARTVTQLP
jgi:hypothetical protein